MLIRRSKHLAIVAELQPPYDAAIVLAKAEARSEAEESLRAEVRAHAQTRLLLERTEANARSSDLALRHHYETLLSTTIAQMNERRRPNKPGT